MRLTLILIIGGTSGIGLETAEYFSKKGHKITIGGRNKPKNSNLEYKYLDVCDEKSIITFFEDISKIDGLVYCTGITSSKKDILNFDQTIWEKIIKTNVTGALLTIKYAYEKFQREK